MALSVLLVAVVGLALPGTHAAGAPGRGAPAASPVAPPVAPLARSPGPTGATELAGAAASLASVEVVNASGSPVWSNITSTAGKAPPYRDYGRSLAYDPLDQYVVLFGGFANTGYLQDTWTFHGGKWKELSPKASPSARDHSTLAWDPVDQYLVLFGGSGNSGAYSDTWTFVGGNWTQLTESTHPSARWASAMTWDAADQELVLFGGCAGSAVGDTWTFASGQWTQLHPTTSPSPRENVVLQYDPVDRYVVLFGGDDYVSNNYADTWSFFNGTWTQLHPVASPSARTEAASAWDPTIGALVLFGGAGSSVLGDTWTFHGGMWTELLLSFVPPAREFGILSNDPADQLLVLFSGAGLSDLDDTWVLSSMNLTATASPPSGPAPVTVQFTANASGTLGAVSYSWSLGDGNVSNGSTANETFMSAGYYQPTVTATAADGGTATLSLVVRVSAPLAIAATAGPTSGVAPLTVLCTALAQGGAPPYVYAWDGDNGQTSSAPSPSFTYTVPGHYIVSVVVTDQAGASGHQSFPVAVSPAVVIPALSVGVIASVLRGPTPLPVTFAANVSGGVPPYSVEWAFGDGATSPNLAVAHTFVGAGDLNTTVTVVDARGVASAATVAVVVTPGLWISAGTPASVRLPNAVVFEAAAGGGTGPYLVSWDFGDGSGATELNVSHTYPAGGDYTATLRVVDALGTVQTQQVAVTVQSAPPVVHPPAPTTNASGGGSSVPAVDLLAGAIVLGSLIVAVTLVALRGHRPRR